ncbi:MAG TPA: ATP-grasp domain-containing protein [Gemmataceae bacterium]|nr:ATP-grasp domain-containing protein [Gemmataceae bacterium]
MRDDLILQAFVVGQSASVSLLIGAHQTIPLLPARQTLSQDDRLQYLGGALPLPAPLAERATALALQAVADIADLRGYVGVDLVLGDDGDFTIEINPRLTTSYLGLRQVCRANLAELMLRCARDESIEPPTWEMRPVVFTP